MARQQCQAAPLLEQLARDGLGDATGVFCVELGVEERGLKEGVCEGGVIGGGRGV